MDVSSRGGDREVSVVIPCRNAARWIRFAIDSVLSQDGVDVEVIAVDDRSSDETVSILESYGDKIRVAASSGTGGSAARNEGAALARGAFVQFLDADDYVLPGKLARQVAFLRREPTDAVYGDWRHQHHDRDGSSHLGRIVRSGEQDDHLRAVLAGWWVAPVAILYCRAAVDRAGGWDESLPAAQDRDYFIRVAMSGARFSYQPGCYSVYRRYGDVTVSTANKSVWLASHRRVLYRSAQALEAEGRLTEEYRRAIAESLFLLARNYYREDSSVFWDLVAECESLVPNFRPPGSRGYVLAQRTVGYRGAELLATGAKLLRRGLASNAGYRSSRTA